MIPYLKTAQNLVSRNSSDLLLVGGVGCMIGGGVLAIMQTPKVMKLMERNKDKKTIEKVKIVAPIYIPSILLTGVGITQIVCSRNITNNRLAAVATAYTVSETAFKTFKDKVKDVVEPDKYEEIKREVANEKLRRDPLGNKEVVIMEKGDTLIYDNMSGRYFKSNINDIEKAANLLNKRMRSEMSIQLNDFYSEIGLSPVKVGCELGWIIDKEDIEVHVSSGIADNGEPCLVIDYEVTPLHR